MAFQIRAATVADVPGICDTYLSAFSEDAISLEVFPRQAGVGKQFWLEMLADEVNDVNAKHFVVTDPSSSSPNHIVAFAKWAVPGAPISEPPPASIWPRNGNPDLAVQFFAALTVGHRAAMGDESHWYLELVAVRRDWKGRGASSPLIRWGLEQADKDRTACFLESSEEAKPIYEKYGFRTVDQFDIETPRGKVTEYFMVRDAPKASS